MRKAWERSCVVRSSRSNSERSFYDWSSLWSSLWSSSLQPWKPRMLLSLEEAVKSIYGHSPSRHDDLESSGHEEGFRGSLEEVSTKFQAVRRSITLSNYSYIIKVEEVTSSFVTFPFKSLWLPAQFRLCCSCCSAILWSFCVQDKNVIVVKNIRHLLLLLWRLCSQNKRGIQVAKMHCF